MGIPPFSPQVMLKEIIELTGYTLSQISEETGISRTTLSRVYNDCCCIIQLRNFHKLFRLYCRLLPGKSSKKG